MFVRCDNDLSDDLTDSHGANRRTFGLFLFAANGGLNCRRAVRAKSLQQQKKTKLRQHLKKKPSAPKSALFCFKNVIFCVPPLFYLQCGGRNCDISRLAFCL